MTYYRRNSLKPMFKESEMIYKLSNNQVAVYDLIKKHKSLSVKFLKETFNCTSAKLYGILYGLRKRNIIPIEKDKKLMVCTFIK